MTGLVHAPDNPVPELAEALVFDGPRKRTVRMMYAPAPSRHGQPRGTVFVCPGRTEFIEKYFEVARDLQARGFAVAIFDWPGQGLSDRFLPDRLAGHVDRFETFVDTLRMGVDQLGARAPEPHVILAHSMGGGIALEALRTGAVLADAAAFSAPMWGIKLPPFGGFIARVLRGFGQGAKPVNTPGPETFENNSVTHDRGRWEVQQSLLRRNPALALSAPTWGWIVASLDVTARFKAPGALDGVQCPVLTASAGEEKLVDNASHEIVCAALPKSTHITVEGAYHEILMETDDKRDQFWTAFDALLDKAGV